MTQLQALYDAVNPCPYCGAQPRFYPAQILVNGDCPESIDCINDDCPVLPSTGYMPIADAIAAWNALAAQIANGEGK